MSMTRYIKDDLMARLYRSEIRAEDLTLHGIAGRYDVSITPVRAALQELIDEGFVTKRSNRRLDVDMSRIARARQSTAVEPVTPVDHVPVITEDLIRLSLKGERLPIREEYITEKYGLCRTSVRQIFHRLAGQGILEHRPRHGWMLVPFQQSDLDAFVEVRAVLERKALELAWPYLVDADLQRMLSANRLPKSSAEKPAIDNSLHNYIVEKSSNRYIADFFARHGRFYQVLFNWEALDRKEMVVAIRQHRRILKALLARNFKAADQALVDHIRSGHPRLTKILDRRGACEPTAPSR